MRVYSIYCTRLIACHLHFLCTFDMLSSFASSEYDLKGLNEKSLAFHGLSLASGAIKSQIKIKSSNWKFKSLYLSIRFNKIKIFRQNCLTYQTCTKSANCSAFAVKAIHLKVSLYALDTNSTIHNWFARCVRHPLSALAKVC